MKKRWTMIGTVGALVSAISAPTIAQRAAPPATALPTTPWTVPADGILQAGCFAWSTRDHAAACIVGFWGHNLPVDSNFSPAWQVHFGGADGVADIPLAPDGAPENPLTQSLAAAPRAALLSRVTAGGYVPLAPLARRLAPDAVVDLGDGVAVRHRHRRDSAGGENQAPTYASTLEIRWAAGGAFEQVDARANEPVATPTVRAFAIPNTPYILLDASRSYADEGESGTIVRAWVCRRDTHHCVAPTFP